MAHSMRKNIFRNALKASERQNRVCVLRLLCLVPKPVWIVFGGS